MINKIYDGFGLGGQVHLECTSCGWKSQSVDNADDNQTSKLMGLEGSHQCLVADRRMQLELRQIIGTMVEKGWSVVDRTKGVLLQDWVGRRCTVTQTEEGCEIAIH